MTKSLALLKLTCFTVLLSVSSIVSANAIKPFSADYDLFRQGEKYGQGNRTLAELDNDRYSLQLSSKIEWLIFSDERIEHSEFLYKNNQITPQSYLFDRTGTGKDKQFSINFSEDKNLYISPKPKKSKLPETWSNDWRDEMTLHLQIQQDLIDGKSEFTYQMLSKSGKLREYKMEVIGKEMIATGAGRFEAIKVARIYEKDKKTQLFAWFIPELNYTLSRLWRIKKGVEQYNLVLASYKQTDK